MMTSSNGNIFRVTGPLCGKFFGEFPSQRPGGGVFFYPRGWTVEQTTETPVIWDAIAPIMRSLLCVFSLLFLVDSWLPVIICHVDKKQNYVVFKTLNSWPVVYLNQLWPNSLSHICTAKRQRVKGLGPYKLHGLNVWDGKKWSCNYFTCTIMDRRDLIHLRICNISCRLIRSCIDRCRVLHF